MLIEREGVVDGEAFYVLAVAARQRQRGRPHAVRDHEDEVALIMELVGRRSVARLLLVMGEDGENDDAGGSNQGPGEERDLSDSPSA